MTLPQDYKNEVKAMIDEAMTKHVQTSTLISAALGFTILGLFVEGLMRLLGIVPPFMGIDISILPR
ncbi:MAG: hypothetical protein CL532_01260 [Aestuariivita sp.]|nr:hypothetical protein [Aestuariivita sp.]|tara:strand:- start:258 stop:455 length:198 start_codon:yes stop_codon:yes gene_type:complete